MTLYLLDANVLIRAHEDYYPIDRIPQFWDWLRRMAEISVVKMPLQIYEEVAASRGMLADWLRQPSVKDVIVLDEPTNLAHVQRVIAEDYAEDLNDVEIVKIGQDPFLIAAALSGSDRIVVTREVSKPSATRANRKVPDVCTSLGIRTMTDTLFRVQNLSIG